MATKKTAARKHWDTATNTFRTRKNTSWVYDDSWKNKSVTQEDIADIITRESLDKDEFTNPKNGDKKNKGNKLHRTYIYRYLVEYKIFDGNRKFYSLSDEDKKEYKEPKGAWAKADKAIDEWNKGAKGTSLEIKDGAQKKYTGGQAKTKSSRLAELMARIAKEKENK